MQLELRLDATILPFPIARRRRLVEQVAQTILRENDDEGLRFWKSTIRSLTDPMLVAGIERWRVERQARDFHDAVQAVMWRTGDRSGGAG